MPSLILFMSGTWVFVEAVELLSDGIGGPPLRVVQPTEVRKPFRLPEAARFPAHVLSYLQQRGIGGDIIRACIETNILYESKSLARSCEDVDDTALSYAEVKALATGDERIKEKMTLDIEVAKLRVYQTDFNSQHYELEDNVRLHFPRQIKENEAKISGLEQDISLYREQKPQDPEAFFMTVLDAGFHERKAAGEAIIEACKTVDCTEQAAEIGKYCGFPIYIQWDAFSKLFHLSLKNTLSHTVDVGLDAVGKGLPQSMRSSITPQKLTSPLSPTPRNWKKFLYAKRQATLPLTI